MSLEWQELKAGLREGLSRGQYDLWVATLEFLRVEHEVLVVGCRNGLHSNWVKNELEERLLRLAQKQLPQLKSIHYEISPTPTCTGSHSEPGLNGIGSRQLAIQDVIGSPKAKFNPRFTFEQFVVGPCNQFAFAASMAVAASRHQYNQSVYLLADPGLGKSHLAHAVGNRLWTRQPDAKVRYVTAEQFTNEMISCLKGDRMESFKRKYREDCDVLLLEKLEFLSGKNKIQSELMFTLDELLDRGKRVICTGNASPKDIPRLNNELRSRLSGVLVAPIDRPDFDTRVAIIKRKASYEQVELPMDVAQFLAQEVAGDIRQLESCLIGILAKSNIMHTPISLGLAREVVGSMLDYLPTLSAQHIVQAVCSSFQVTVDDLRSPARSRQVTLARHLGMYLCRHYTRESLSSIGTTFGRSHSSVVYALKKMKSEVAAKNSSLKRQLEHISQRLETRCLF